MKLFYIFRIRVVSIIKIIFGIQNFSLFVRKLRQRIEKLFYHKKYTADDVVLMMQQQGLKSGSIVMVHCAMNNFYNFKGTAIELIEKILNCIGEEGTLCMPAYPYDKDNNNNIFNVRATKTAAGYLAETFRQYPGVKRSLNQLHSVCAYGKYADFLISEHHYSKTCFDEKSPFYKISQLGGITFNLGLPKWYVGTIVHVCESLLLNELSYFKKKFTEEIEFQYIDWNGEIFKHKMWTKPYTPYIRNKSTYLFDKYFNKKEYARDRLSNIWITSYKANYLVYRLSELAYEGITIYDYPIMTKA